MKFIETESKSDKIAYINFCDKNLKILTDSQVGLLMASFSKHFTGADAATKKAAAKFLRNHIGEQSVDVIYFTSSQIGNLEGRGHWAINSILLKALDIVAEKLFTLLAQDTQKEYLFHGA